MTTTPVARANDTQVTGPTNPPSPGLQALLEAIRSDVAHHPDLAATADLVAESLRRHPLGQAELLTPDQAAGSPDRWYTAAALQGVEHEELQDEQLNRIGDNVNTIGLHRGQPAGLPGPPGHASGGRLWRVRRYGPIESGASDGQ